jgi:uncharacterized delta-60 repeat protein
VRKRSTIALAFVVCAGAAAAAPAPGDLDLTWGRNGITRTPLEQRRQRVVVVHNLTTSRGVVLVDGVLTGHQDEPRLFLARYTSQGRLDKGFGGSGLLRDRAAGRVGLALPNGKTLLVGNTLRRLTRAGRADPTFGVRGTARLHLGRCRYYAVYRLVRQPDGKLVLDVLSCQAVRDFSDNRYTLMRVHANGRIDRTFGKNGVTTVRVGVRTGLTWTSELARQSDGKLVLAGRAWPSANRAAFAVARFLPNGRLDRSFGARGVVMTALPNEPYVEGLFVQPDGKLLLAGCSASGTEAPSDTLILRYLQDGSLDRSWGSGGIRSYGDLGVASRGSECPDVAMTPRRELLVLGSRLWRLRPDGSIDSSFGRDGSIAIGPGDALGVQADGKIVLAGGTVLSPRRLGIDVRRYHGG